MTGRTPPYCLFLKRPCLATLVNMASQRILGGVVMINGFNGKFMELRNQTCCRVLSELNGYTTWIGAYDFH